jgi:hypothetical protein
MAHKQYLSNSKLLKTTHMVCGNNRVRKVEVALIKDCYDPIDALRISIDGVEKPIYIHVADDGYVIADYADSETIIAMVEE